jgi:hypothetical protein
MAGSATPANNTDPQAIATLRLTLTERSPGTQKHKWRSNRAPPGTDVPFVKVRKFVREVTKADRWRGTNKAQLKSEVDFAIRGIRRDDRKVDDVMLPLRADFSRAATGQDDLLIAMPRIRITTLIGRPAKRPAQVHAQIIAQPRDETLRIMKDNPGLAGTRCLLHLYERDEAAPLIGAG